MGNHWTKKEIELLGNGKNKSLDRIDSGFKLNRDKKVRLKEYDSKNAYYEFEVESRTTKGKIYPVYCDNGHWNCPECPDFTNRWNEAGALTCGHIAACFFKLAEIKGVNQQAKLEAKNG